MMRLMPVRSPLPLSALWSGVLAGLSPTFAERARDDVRAALAPDGERLLLLVDSGTSALSLALRHSSRGSGRAVALPAFGCYDIATAVDGAAVPFVLYDIDPVTLGPDFASLRRALEAGADRVVIAHLYGMPVDIDTVASLAREYGAMVIEDAAQGAGASWNGRALGQHGSLGVLSFGRGKGVTAGRGGALLGNDLTGNEVVDRASAAPGHSTAAGRELLLLAAQWLLARRGLYWLPASIPLLRLGETTYRPALDARMPSSLSLGVLSGTLPGSAAEAAVRRQNAAALLAAMPGGRLSPVSPVPNGRPGYLRLPAVAEGVPGTFRDSGRRLGIMPSYPRSLAELDGFGTRGLGGALAMPGAGRLARELITLPVHGALTERDLERVIAWVRLSGA